MVLKITGLGGSDCLYIRAADYLHHCYTCKRDKQARWKAAIVRQLPLGVGTLRVPAAIWMPFSAGREKASGKKTGIIFAPTFYARSNIKLILSCSNSLCLHQTSCLRNYWDVIKKKKKGISVKTQGFKFIEAWLGSPRRAAPGENTLLVVLLPSDSPRSATSPGGRQHGRSLQFPACCWV